jgi:hypothetical protein
VDISCRKFVSVRNLQVLRFYETVRGSRNANVHYRVQYQPTFESYPVLGESSPRSHALKKINFNITTVPIF